MTGGLDAYAPFVGAGTIEELRLLGDQLRGRRVQNINSTAVGGGVAEILNRLIPLLREVGIDARWDVMRGGDEFYAVTKAIHNGLHGKPVPLTEQDVEVFRQTTRQVDSVARYGGEEFVVMLLEANMATAMLVAERIRARVAEQDLGQGTLTLSIGVAEYPDGGDTPEELIATADAAMYKAKNAGRNQVVVAGSMEQRPQPQEKEKKTRRKREA